MITLTAACRCNLRYTPGAKKPYIARITGRDSKVTFAREFIGAERVDVDTPGLYETRGVDKKGRGDDPEYVLVLESSDGEVGEFTASKEDAMKIAKAFDAGRPIESIVALTPDGEWEFVTAARAERAAVAATIDDAAERCWQIVLGLPAKDGKKVLDVLRKRLNPPKPAAALGFVETTPAGVVADANLDAGVPEGVMGLSPTPVAEPTEAVA